MTEYAIVKQTKTSQVTSRYNAANDDDDKEQSSNANEGYSIVADRDI